MLLCYYVTINVIIDAQNCYAIGGTLLVLVFELVGEFLLEKFQDV